MGPEVGARYAIGGDGDVAEDDGVAMDAWGDTLRLIRVVGCSSRRTALREGLWTGCALETGEDCLEERDAWKLSRVPNATTRIGISRVSALSLCRCNFTLSHYFLYYFLYFLHCFLVQ